MFSKKAKNCTQKTQEKLFIPQWNVLYQLYYRDKIKVDKWHSIEHQKEEWKVHTEV